MLPLVYLMSSLTIQIRCFVLILVLSGSSVAYSQIQLGLKAAYSLSFSRSTFLLFEDENDFLNYEIIFRDEDIRPVYGLISYYEQEKVFVQLEALYKQSRLSFTAIDWSTPEFETFNETKVTHFIVIPTLAGYRIANFKLGAGPVFSFIAQENEIFAEIQEFSERRRNLEIGVSANVGVKLYRLHIDANYEYHFNRVADYILFDRAQAGFAQSPGFFTLGISYLLF